MIDNLKLYSNNIFCMINYMSIIKISPIAHNIFRNMIKKTNYKYITFGLKSGGCSGFQYYFKPNNDPVDKLDEIIDMKQYKIKINNSDLFKLIDTEIDYETNFLESKFVFKNPNSEFTCGCGKSFS